MSRREAPSDLETNQIMKTFLIGLLSIASLIFLVPQAEAGGYRRHHHRHYDRDCHSGYGGRSYYGYNRHHRHYRHYHRGPRVVYRSYDYYPRYRSYSYSSRPRVGLYLGF